MRIPYLNLERSYELISVELNRAFKKVLKSGWVILGQELENFENEYASFNSTKYAIGVANGLDALILSLTVLGIKKGDEVIVPSNTYIATLIAVSRVGATPILVEPLENTFNINPSLIEEKISKNTKAIIPVHLYGQACQMSEIVKIAKKHKLFIVEDNAQAHGAEYKGKKTGSFGILNATSFYPGKNLGALGDGGAITTDKEHLNTILRILRNYGEEKRYVNNIIGYNSRLDELQAAFLRVRLRVTEEITKNKIKIAATYDKGLKNIGDIETPYIARYSSHVYHVYAIKTKKRNALRDYLLTKGITTLIHYPIPPHLQKAYKHLGFKKGDFPISEKLADVVLSLPIFPEMKMKEVEYVVGCIKEFYKT